MKVREEDEDEDFLNGNQKQQQLQYENVTLRRGSPESATSSNSSSCPSSVDEVDRLNNNDSNVDLRNPYSRILMEIDQIKISDQEKLPMDNSASKVDNKPKPAPRSRTTKPQPTQYENHEIRTPPQVTGNAPEIIISSSTGAIKKQPTTMTRVAPPRPPSPVFRNKTPEVEKPITTKAQESVTPEKMTRSSSSNTLDSSQDGSEASGSKFKTSSPGQVRDSIKSIKGGFSLLIF